MVSWTRRSADLTIARQSTLPDEEGEEWTLDVAVEQVQERSEDGTLDEATGFLNGEWLGGDQAVQEILERDRKQVYDTTIEKNLEVCETRDKWRNWVEFAIGRSQPDQKAHASSSEEAASEQNAKAA